MFEKQDLLDLMLEEIARIHKIRECDKGDYRHGRSLMLQSADQLDHNIGWALRTMRKARRSFEQESDINRRYHSFKGKWALMPSFHFKDEERALEQDLRQQLSTGDFDDCLPILENLELLLDQDVADHIEIGLELEVAAAEVQLGRGTTLTIHLHNHSVFPIQVDSLTARSPQAAISVLDFYRGEMPPGNDRSFQINVIPKVEGDIAVEIVADVENDSRLLKVKKGFSLKVTAPQQVVQVRSTTSNEMQYANPSPMIVPRTSSYDPMELLSSGTVDQWADCLEVFARARTPIELAGMVQRYPDYIRSDGYANLLKALLAMPYDRSIAWDLWFSEAGLLGEEYTRRCSKLLFRMGSLRSVELDLDGSVGSSNIENLIGAMQVASGDIRREERSRKSWKVEGEIDGHRFSLLIDKKMKKDEAGKAVAASFVVSSG